MKLQFGIDRNTNLLVSSAVVIAIRVLAVRYKLALPGFRKPAH